MSVILTWMDIPENCDNCLFYVDENMHCKLGCFIPFSQDGCRHKDCPLKSVDGLIAKISHIQTSNSGEKRVRDFAVEIIEKYCRMEG